MRTVGLLLLLSAAACTGPGTPAGAFVEVTVDVQRPHVMVSIDDEPVDPGGNTTSHAVSKEFHFDSWDQAMGTHTVSFSGDGVNAGTIVVPGGRCVGACAANTCTSDVKWEWSAVVIDKDGNASLDCLRCLDSNSQALFQDCPPAP